ncbi:Biotin synthase [subsurface metagenome]
MNQKELLTLAETIIDGDSPAKEQYRAIADIPESHAFTLLTGADMIRDHYFGRRIHLCTICNGKSGRCSEDCGFCAQSVFAKTDAPVYPLMEKAKLQEGGRHACQGPINRYAIVTSGKRLPRSEVGAVAEAIAGLDQDRIKTCASMGILDAEDFRILKNAGVSRYHHNLETAQSYFTQVCTTHTYQQRIDTILVAKEAGLSVCSGGVFGIGETDEQVLELALALKGLDVDAVPINFLVPVAGTKLENSEPITPLRCLKIIAIFRYVLPEKEIIICGGRESNLKELHPLIFHAGASGIMTNNYLTTSGRSFTEDLEMLEHLKFEIVDGLSRERTRTWCP